MNAFDETLEKLLSRGLRRAAIGLAATLVVAAIGGCRQDHSASQDTTITGGEPFHGLLPYREKDAKLALVRPVFVAAETAQLADGVSVVGVTVDDVHRAYPLYVMKNHQVVNDRLAEVPIAASW